MDIYINTAVIGNSLIDYNHLCMTSGSPNLSVMISKNFRSIWFTWIKLPRQLCLLLILSPLTVQSSLSVMWHLVWYASMYANVKRQKSIKHWLRTREDIIRIIQTFSHASVSVSDRDDCLLCGSPALVFRFVLSLTATGQSEGRQSLWEESVTSQRRWKLVVPD